MNHRRVVSHADEHSNKNNALIPATSSSSTVQADEALCRLDQIIMKERPDNGPKTEVDTLDYVANNPSIPAPKIIRD